MRRKAPSFIVEVKRKRGQGGTPRSLWSDVDLAAFGDGATQAAAPQQQDLQHVDAARMTNAAREAQQTRMEPVTAAPQEVEPAPAVTGEPPKVEAPEPQQKAPRQKRAKADKPKATASEKPARKTGTKQAVKAAEAPTAPVMKGKRKTYSEKERTQKLAQIERSISGGESVRNAIKQTGISEQTYYQWKKAVTSTAPASTGDDLQDLLALEKENERLKKQLAEHLRKENAELKKKLGLARP